MEEFLGSNKEVNLDKSPVARRVAAELTKYCKTDLAKIKIIAYFVSFLIRYDRGEQQAVKEGKLKGYLPLADEVLLTRKGICWDYASLLAVMLRSIGIPTKLVKGYADYAPDVYHAWNEVLYKGQWKTIDPTYKSGNPFSTLFRNPNKYKKAREL
jgi:transglutaminase-like putative cysteine protease